MEKQGHEQLPYFGEPKEIPASGFQTNKIFKFPHRSKLIKKEHRKDWSLDEFDRGTSFFTRLKEKGVNIVRHSNFIEQGDEHGHPISHTIADEIDGKRLDKIEHIPEEYADTIDVSFAALFAEKLEAFESGGQYWDDFQSDHSQFMLGRTSEHEDIKLYLVDVDPHIKEFSGKKEEGEVFAIAEDVITEAEMIRDAERRLGERVKLPLAREALGRLIARIKILSSNKDILSWVEYAEGRLD